jgi:SAM-dependent methyltransferase
MSIWEKFKIEKVNEIFQTCQNVLDIGGGLRIDKTKNNRFNPQNYNSFFELSRKVNYKIMDPVADYNPDVVGDIHKMPFKNDELDAIICIAVLEHVEDPIRAVEDCYRVLKPGGKAFFYQPFLFYYHAEVGYYKDYWRFSEDANRYMFKNFKHFEICPVMGRFATIGRLVSPKYLQPIGNFLDYILPKNSKQVSGYYVYVQK